MKNNYMETVLCITNVRQEILVFHLFAINLN